jgi:DNA-binding transcriptional regulator YhcF (GntR family)
MEVRRDINIPLYKQIYDAIKNSILTGEYKSGELMPSERELSNMFSVDRITVRRPLEMLANDGLVEKIAGLGTRVVGFPERDIVAATSNNILFVLPKTENNVDRITEPFNSSLFYRIEKECKKKGYNLTYTTLGKEDSLTETEKRNNTTGIIYVSRQDERLYEETIRLKIPAILVNNTNDLFTSIVIDNEKGAYDAVKYLTGLGHKQIGYVGDILSDIRYHAMCNVMEQKGLVIRPEYIKRGTERFELGGYLRGKELLAEKELPTAVIASPPTSIPASTIASTRAKSDAAPKCSNLMK